MHTLRMRALLGFMCLALGLAACQPKAAPPTSRAPLPTPRTGHLAPGEQPEPVSISVLVDEVEHIVEARASEQETFFQVTPGFELKEGWQVRTGDNSSALLLFGRDTLVRLEANTLFTFNSQVKFSDGLFTSLSLTVGKLWVSLLGGGSLEADTPVGVASIRGSFASFTYTPGADGQPQDDVLVVDCLEGACEALNAEVHEYAGNLERIVLGRGRDALTRFVLSGEAVAEFLERNPDGQAIVATLTAAAPSGPTEAPEERDDDETLEGEGTPTPAPAAAATATPGEVIHIILPTLQPWPTATHLPVASSTPREEATREPVPPTNEPPPPATHTPPATQPQSGATPDPTATSLPAPTNPAGPTATNLPRPTDPAGPTPTNLPRPTNNPAGPTATNAPAATHTPVPPPTAAPPTNVPPPTP